MSLFAFGKGIAPSTTHLCRMGQNLLLTGGAGYIGSTVARQLVAAGHKVVILDDLSAGKRENVPTGAELRVGDFADSSLLAELLGDSDAVLHFAAFTEVGQSMAQPITHFSNNTARTIFLLEAMVKHNVDRFVFSSTAAIYGTPERMPVDEQHPTRPENPYGQSKLMVEQVLGWLHDRTGFRYASLRYFNAAGGRSNKGAVNLIPIVLEVATGARPYLEVFGTDYPTRDGTAVRDYIHVEDLASAHLLALNALESRGRLICNLGNGIGFTVQEVVEVARRVTGHPIPVEESPRRAGDPAEVMASSEVARRELGWQPCYAELEVIVRSAWESTGAST